MRRWADVGNSRDEYQVLEDIRELLLVVASAVVAQDHLDTDETRQHLVRYLARRREEVEDATD